MIRGRVHDYPGMHLYYSVKGQAKITMMDHIKEIMEYFDNYEQKDTGTKSSATTLDMFAFDEDCDKIKKENMKHSTRSYQRCYFLPKRTRVDTGTSIYYLMTRVKDPDQSNWMNMVHMFKCVRGNKYLPLILSADKSVMIKWYIYGSYVVHPNTRGNTGGGLKMG